VSGTNKTIVGAASLVGVQPSSAKDIAAETPWNQHPVHAISLSGVLTAAECEAVRRDTLAVGMSRGLVLTRTGFRPSRRRTCDEARLPRAPKSEWLYERILAKTDAVNAEYWRFALNGIEEIRVLRYKSMQRFREHFDTYPGSPRKLTCVINLSSPASYWRGGLRVKGAHQGKAVAGLQGSATWFPCYLVHKAAAPWRGERWALVALLTGPPWV